LEAINVTNHPYFAAPGTNMSNQGTFGVINSASNSRAMQGGLKLTF
jgi:galactose mutarotase-like enzyme